MIASNLFTLLAVVGAVSAAPFKHVKRDSTGTATYYAAGLGACGWTNSGSDFVVAVNQAQYSKSDCGSYITITDNETGNTQTAQIADLCPSCAWGNLDLSTSLFSALHNGNMDAGVVSITWNYGGQNSNPSPTPSSTSTGPTSPSAAYNDWAAVPSSTESASSSSYTWDDAVRAQPSTSTSSDHWWSYTGEEPDC